MARKNPIAMVVLGAAGAAGGLALSPGTYAWLRRTLKLDDDRSHYADRGEDDPVAGSVPVASDTSLADARLTLRARLQESGVVADEGAPVAAPSTSDVAAEARSRLRAKVEEAKAALLDEDRTDEIEPAG